MTKSFWGEIFTFYQKSFNTRDFFLPETFSDYSFSALLIFMGHKDGYVNIFCLFLWHRFLWFFIPFKCQRTSRGPVSISHLYQDKSILAPLKSGEFLCVYVSLSAGLLDCWSSEGRAPSWRHGLYWQKSSEPLPIYFKLVSRTA